MNRINLISYHFGENGFGKYGQALHRSLINQMPIQSVNRICFDFKSKSIIKTTPPLASIKQCRVIPFFDNFLFFGFRNRNALSGESGSLNHILCQTLSFLTVPNKIITCHDMIPFKMRQGIDVLIARLKYMGLKEAEAIIAISDHTRKDLMDFGIDETKIHRIYLGVKPLQANISPDELRQKFKVPAGKRYLLYVGSEEPRKNFVRLLQAVAKIGDSAGTAHLIKVGEAGAKRFRDQSLKTARALGLNSKVSFTGHVSEEELATFYAMADVFLFPSLYEGFGLPPLEAMASGTPVISSNSSSLPEVVGDAAIMINPHDVESLAKAIVMVLGSESLQKKLSEKGLEQAGRFTWKKCADETAKVYDSVLSKINNFRSAGRPFYGEVRKHQAP
ncbi:MAG: glycosyltransferase family 1 protein [Desulfobacteraceae bacterium]|jgi:glycosyltransferase involved in cell wall biosynthesis|nr:MAG: glycosyltransferase family 1 protein [Desulfobacteraceae bacterium]